MVDPPMTGTICLYRWYGLVESYVVTHYGKFPYNRKGKTTDMFTILITVILVIAGTLLLKPYPTSPQMTFSSPSSAVDLA